MELAYVGDSAYRLVIEHSKNITLAITESTEAVVVESATIEPPTDLPAINTCPGVRALAINREWEAEFRSIHNVKDAYPATFLYGFISASGLSDMMEMTYSTRFLTGEIGPQVTFSKGTGLKCVEDLGQAVPDLPALVKSLVEIEYRGEIAFGITKDFHICAVRFGNFPLGFALYTEISKFSPQDNYEWCLDVGEAGRLNDSISVATLLSYPDYPYDTSTPLSIKAPASAEKHMYRFMVDATEVAYSAAWGEDIMEAKRRCRKTIDNCRNYNKDIQYRIDYGYKESFIISAERWLSLGGIEPRVN
jgi:hypothetical protein